MAVTIPLLPTCTAGHTQSADTLALLSEGVAESGYKLLPKSPRPDTNHTSDSLHVMSPTHLFHLSLPDTYRVFRIPVASPTRRETRHKTSRFVRHLPRRVKIPILDIPRWGRPAMTMARGEAQAFVLPRGMLRLRVRDNAVQGGLLKIVMKSFMRLHTMIV